MFLFNGGLKGSVSASPVTEDLWGVRQDCSFKIKDPKNSIDRSFNKKVAGCQGKYAEGNKFWTFSDFQDTQDESINKVVLEIHFIVSDWKDDTLLLQITNNNGGVWNTLDTFDPSNPPPFQFDTFNQDGKLKKPKTYDVSKWFGTPRQVNAAQVRLRGEKAFGEVDEITVLIDETRLTVTGLARVSAIPTPGKSPTMTLEGSRTQTETTTLTATQTGTVTATQASTVTVTVTPAQDDDHGRKATPTLTPTLTITGTPLTSTPTLTGTVETTTPTPTPTITGTVITGTPNLTETITPTETATPMPVGTEIPGIHAALLKNAPLVSQGLWGTAQTCTSCTLTNPANSIDLAFNGLAASTTAPFGNGSVWTFTAIQDTTLASIIQVTIDVNFMITGWVDDQIDLEIYNGTAWTRIARFAAGAPPPSVLTTQTYDVSSLFTSQTQVNNAQFRIRGTLVAGGTADNVTIAFDEISLNAGDSYPPRPTPPAPAPAPTSVPSADDPHVHYNSGTDACAGCHRSHIDAGPHLRGVWGEENVCFACHTSGGTGTNIQPAFTALANTATRFFKHDVTATTGVHQLTESAGSAFSGAFRHVECEDCHQPHRATRGAASAPMLPREMQGSSGVNPNWAGTGSPASFTWLTQADREYQVCLKCHSSFSTLPTYQPDGWGWNGTAYNNFVANGLRKLTSTDARQVLDSRDMAKEFNPYNTSFHPVAATGRNTNIPSASFVSGWSTSSLVYCSDCHTNSNPASGANGPHGSPLLHLLGGAGATPHNYTTVENTGSSPIAANTGDICFKCHVYSVYVSGGSATATNFRNGTENYHTLHSFAACYACHDSHGSEQLHLINFNVLYAVPNTGYNSQTAFVPSVTGGSCYLACHGHNHSPETYSR